MVKKLIKYESAAYMRTMIPMLIIVLGIGLLTRFVQLFENTSDAYSIVNVSSIVALVISVIVALIMTVFVGITRFYKNLFTNEGYLSFTLPVTPSGHIFAKLIAAVVFEIVTVIACVAALAVASAGDLLHEIIKAINYLMNGYFKALGGHGAVYIIEAVLAALSFSVCKYLLFYACISVGQLAKKNRVLLAFGVFFGYYFAMQILGTIFIIITDSCFDALADEISCFASNHPFAFVHCVIWFAIVCELIGAVIYYLVSRYIIKRRLNLE